MIAEVSNSGILLLFLSFMLMSHTKSIKYRVFISRFSLTAILSVSAYNNQVDEVIEVSAEDFYLCTTASPIAVCKGGCDSITSKKPGYYFLVSVYETHYYDGLKASMEVTLAINISIPSPIDSESPSPAPSTPSANSSSNHIKLFGKLPFGVLLIVASFSNFLVNLAIVLLS